MGSWSDLAQTLISNRADFAAINLQDGTILITGGRSAPSGPTLSSCEIFDPGTGSTTATGSMSTNRRDHALIVLDDGRVLAVGGENGAGAGTVISTCEIFDPNAGTWSAASSLGVGRSQFPIWKLSGGRVLVAGGFISPSAATATSEIYDPNTDTWSFTSPFNIANPVGSVSFTTLADGSPFATCGLKDYATLVGYKKTWKYNDDLFFPAWTELADYPIPMFPDITNNALLLNNNKVLVTGGFASTDATAACYLYDPVADTWTATGSLNDARWDHCSWFLQNGDVLVASGTQFSAEITSSEIYDHIAGTWSTTGSTNHCHTISNTVGINLFSGTQPWIAGGVSGGSFNNPTIETFTSGSPPPMAITLVQRATNYDSLADMPVNFSSGTTAGNTIIVRIQARQSGSFTITGVTDNAGSPNTYTKLTGAASTESGSPNGANEIWYCANCNAGATTVTLHASTSISGFQGLIEEYSGIDYTSPVEASNATSDATATTSLTTPSISITNGNDLLVAIGDSVGAIPNSVSAPWTGQTGAWGALRCFANYLAPGSTGSFTATFNGTAAGNGAVSIAAFQPTITGPSAKQKASSFLVL